MEGETVRERKEEKILNQFFKDLSVWILRNDRIGEAERENISYYT